MVKSAFSLLLLVVAMAPGLLAQAAPPRPTASPTYLVGPSDVLGIKVLDEPSLSTAYNVDSDGTITFPFLGRIDVAGKTLREIEALIQTGLRADYVKRAEVSVEITTFRSRSIYVMGEVKAPGKYTIDGPVTLLEVIAKAGSFTPSAGPTLIVQRYKDGMAAAVSAPLAPGDERWAEVTRINLEELREGKLSANLLLQDSDMIIVPAAERYYVSGFVKQPGSFVLRPGMSVRQAIAEAGGLTERGSTRGVKILRKDKTGREIEIDVSMSDPVQPNDTIKIRQRLI